MTEAAIEALLRTECLLPAEPMRNDTEVENICVNGATVGNLPAALAPKHLVQHVGLKHCLIATCLY